jgi:predicted Zn-dependent peptidase
MSTLNKIKLENFQITLQRENTNKGLKFVHFKKTSSPIAIKVCSRSGSRYDPATKEGLAHFVEHAVLDGTEKFPNKKELSLVLDDIGGSYSGATSPELVCFDFLVATKEYLPLIGEITDQIINKPLLEEKTIESEKKIIKTEIAQRLDDPKRVISSGTKILMYGNNPIARNAAGNETSIVTIDRKDLLSHIENTLPKDMTVISCGDCDIKELINTFETKLPYKKSIEKPETPTLLQEKKFGVTKLQDQKLVNCLIAFPTCGIGSEDCLSLGLASSYFGRSRASLLKEILRYENNLLYSVTTGNSYFSDTGFFAIEMGIKQENLETAVIKISETLSKLKQEGINQKSLDIIKNKVINSSLINTQTVQSWVGNHYYRNLLVRDNNYFYNDYLNEVENISKETVDTVIKKYLIKDNLYFYVAGNLEENTIEDLYKKLSN